MKKVMSIFGTRPEAIKMAPLVKTIEKTEGLQSVVVVTAQHREMLDQVLELFEIKPDYDLNIMKANQTLTEITARALMGLESILKEEKPDLVLVHGDTTTTFVASLASFYQQIPVGHVEAGLRSGDMYSPFPEEVNRKLTGGMANLHFAPTGQSRENLLKEGISPDYIYTTGNTVIDALLDTVKDEYSFENAQLNEMIANGMPIVLITAHRRENHGKPMEQIFKAILQLQEEFKEVQFVFPVHKNPKVRELAAELLQGKERIHLIEPLDYEPFANLMAKAHLILTDSGGLQEEAPALGKPVLVLRDNTERPEAVDAGTVKLVGTDQEEIYTVAKELLSNPDAYAKMEKAINPYGDGKASERIAQGIQFYFGMKELKPQDWK